MAAPVAGAPYNTKDVVAMQLDEPGLKLATGYADGSVKVWSTMPPRALVGDLRTHQACICGLAWAHGRLARTLASASDDGQVVLWREVKPGDWKVVYQHKLQGGAGATSLTFCSPEFGFVLAVGGSDGTVTMITRQEVAASPVLPAGERWSPRWFGAHQGTIHSLSWAPGSSPATLATGLAVKSSKKAPKHLVTCGSDRKVRVWNYDESLNAWTHGSYLEHESVTGQTQQVAYRPNPGIPANHIATCTDTGCVAMWCQDMEGQPWRLQQAWSVGDDARRLSWSPGAGHLYVSFGDSSGKMFKETSGNNWLPASSSECLE